MRDVFILENMSACNHFVQEHLDKGYTQESFLGIGSFSSLINSDDGTGLNVKVIPNFLEKDIISYIVQGDISPFERDPILVHAQPNNDYTQILRWLLICQHPAIFSIKNTNYPKISNFGGALTLDEFVVFCFSNVISKINEIKAEIAILLFDIEFFKNFFLKVVECSGRDVSELLKKTTFQENDLEKKIIKEIIYFFSNSFFNSVVAIVPSNYKHYNLLIDSAHLAKKEFGIYSKDINFRL